MATYTFTYDSNKTSDVVLKSLAERENGAYVDGNIFQRCCGSLAYLSLFLLPGFELADKSTISIEQVCTATPGIFKYDMHDLLYCLGAIACGAEVVENLKKILDLPTLYECLKFLHVAPVDWTRIFLYVYLVNTETAVSLDALKKIVTYDQLICIFKGDLII